MQSKLAATLETYVLEHTHIPGVVSNGGLLDNTRDSSQPISSKGNQAVLFARL